MKICYRCRKEIISDRKVGRSEVCLFCQADLHVCRNCQFYDPGAYNQCHEPQAERVLDKDRSNFCDWFAFRDSITGNSRDAGRNGAKDKLAALFKAK